MSNILVTGSSSGLGKAIAHTLSEAGHWVVGYDLDDGCNVAEANDIEHELMAQGCLSSGKVKLDVLINCAGVNIINWLEDFTEAQWDKVMNVNAKGIFKMTQACLPFLIKSQGTVLNITSNASHMPMTCSLAYNASKGAAHIMTLQLARELTKKHGITVFGVAPNKLRETGMSASIDEQVVATRGWTKEYAQQYQLNGLLCGEETPPEAVAEFIAFLLQDKAHHKHLTGCILPYGA